MEKTKNYSLFKKYAKNRDIDGRHVEKLIASIKTANLLDCEPILVNEKMEVIDGQHRLEAAKSLNLDIY